MPFCAARVIPILIFLLALATCWCFAIEWPYQEQVDASPSSQDSSDLCSDSCNTNIYGDSLETSGTTRKKRQITALNLAETIFSEEQRLASSLEAAADQLGSPVLPVTGVDDMSDIITSTLEEQYQDHEAKPPHDPDEAREAFRRNMEFGKVAESVLEHSIAATQSKPPQFEPLDDLLPARVWTPVYEGCSPKFLEARCNYHKPSPRLFVTNLNELISARSLLQGQERQIEPLTLRQTHAQFLTLGWRSKKDPYSRASLTNDVAYGTCRAMEERTPEHVVF